MAQYDGAIRINTQIDSKNASVQLMTLENRIVKTADRIASLRQKMESLKNAKISTQEYTEVQKQIENTEKKLAALTERQEKYLATGGKESSSVYRKMVYDAEQLNKTLEYAKGEMQELVNDGKAFTLGSGTDEYADYARQLKYAENEMETLNQKHEVLGLKVEKSENEYKKLGRTAENALKRIGSAIKGSVISSMQMLGSAAKKAASSIKGIASGLLGIGKNAKSASGGISGMSMGFKSMLKYAFGIRSLYALVNKFRAAVKEGMGNLAQYSAPVNAALSSLKSSLTQLKNSLATAFAPILTAIAPALTTLINLASRAATAVGMLVAALTGQSTFTKATAVQEDYAKSLGGTAKAAKNANRQLSSLDKLNNLTTQDSGGGGGGSGAGGAGDMFETVEIPSAITDLADRIKDVWGAIWEVFEASWETKGVAVVESAKSALLSLKLSVQSVGNTFFEVFTSGTGLGFLNSALELVRSILDVVTAISDAFRMAWDAGAGFELLTNLFVMLTDINLLIAAIADSFSAVFSNGTGVEIWTNILGIISGVFDIVSSLAEQFRIAWENAGLGDGIMQGILNLVNSVLETVHNIVDATAEWAGSLDFTPLLESVNGLLESLQPLTENIGAGLEWFWNNVLLPIAGWAIQDAVPVFLDMLSAAIETLNAAIDVLKPVGSWLWENFLVPLGQWTGDLLISAMETITNLFKFFTDILSESGDSTSIFSEIVDTLSSAWSGLIEILTPLANFLQTTLMSVWNDMISPALEYIAKTVLPILIETFENLWNNVLVPLGEFVGSVLGPVFQILADLLSALWENVVVPLAQAVGSVLKKAFEGLSEILNKTVIPVINTVIKVFQFLWNKVFSPIVSHLKNVFGPVFSSIFGTIKTVIQNLQKIFGGLIDFITGIFTGNWKKAWGGITSIFEGIFGVIKGVINGILGVIEGLANGVIKGINIVIGALNKLKFDIPDWVPALGGKSFGFNIPELSQISIPKLATGAVIPANKEFLAVLGDQKHGTNIEAPLDTIKQANKEAFLEVLSKLGVSAGNSRSSGNETFVFQVDGRTFFEITRKYAQEYWNRTGNSPFPI